MATRDFRSQQIRISQIIASGTTAGNAAPGPSLLIYSASKATNDQGGYSATMLSNVDNRAWLFISGSTNTDDGQNISFGGNVGVSGSITGSSFATFPGTSLTLSSNDSMNFVIDADGGSTSTFSFKSAATEVANLDESGNLQIDGNLTVGTDADGNDRTVTFAHSTLKSVIGIDDDQDVFAINTDAAFEATNDFEIDASGNVTIGAGTLTLPSDIVHSGDTDTKIGFDTNSIKLTAGNQEAITLTNDGVTINEASADYDFRVESNGLQSAVHVNAGQDIIVLGRSGAPVDYTGANLGAGPDVNIVLDGTPGSKGGGSRGVTVARGDLVVSGTLYAEKQVMEVDLSQTGQLIMTGGIHFYIDFIGTRI